MPVSLKVLVCLLSLGVLANLVDGSILSAAFGAAMVVGLCVGNNGVRVFMQVLAVIQIIWNTILIAIATAVAGPTYVLWGVIGIALPVFMIWTLSRPHVRDWMFRKNFNLADVPAV